VWRASGVEGSVPGSSPGPDTSKPSRHDRDVARAIKTLKSVTARYRDLDSAKKDGFALLHGCQVLPGHGPVGTVYFNPSRLIDGGHIDPRSPEALIYEPQSHAPPKLVGVEFAISFGDWDGAEAPQFLGISFQPEDESSVFGLHVWVWSDNPNGMFAQTNPNVSCKPA
jgi:hypothetical protein